MAGVLRTETIETPAAKQVLTADVHNSCAPQNLAINGNYTLADEDHGKIFRVNTTCTISISANLRNGFECGFVNQTAAVVVTFAGIDGMTIRTNSKALTLSTLYAVCAVYKHLASNCVIFGELD